MSRRTAAIVLGALAIGLGVVLAMAMFDIEPRLADDAPPAERVKKPKAAPKVAPGAAPVEDEAASDEPAEVRLAGELPETLGRRELEATIAKVRPRVEACKDLDANVAMVQARLVIAPSGNLKAIEVTSPPGPTPLTQCVQKALKAATFPRFAGKILPEVELSVPFLLRPMPSLDRGS